MWLLEALLLLVVCERDRGRLLIDLLLLFPAQTPRYDLQYSSKGVSDHDAIVQLL